jgi:galactokinase
MSQAVRAAFARCFGKPPAFVVRAPGRVNLIGEHTDYNGGFVLPMAIDRWVSLALAPRSDRRVRVASAEFEETTEFSLDDLGPRGSGWTHYVKGTAWALAEAGHALEGWEGVVSGDVPMGAGLSSSAAFEMAVARAFTCVSGFAWDPVAMALVAQRAENAWVGVGCGIMDPLISGCGRAGHALLLDCRSLESRPVPLPAETAVVVLDTATRRSLSHSGYNERRAQCESAAIAFGVAALRDVAVAQLGALRHCVDDTLFRRARHVVTENARTLAAADVLAAGGAGSMGRLMDESHASLRDDFAVSTPPIEAMVRAARETPGCVGARMTGGGFGGCVVALVESGAVATFEALAVERYRRETGLEPRVYVCRGTDGVEVL